jgi:hypothetical protein
MKASDDKRAVARYGDVTQTWSSKGHRVRVEGNDNPFREHIGALLDGGDLPDARRPVFFDAGSGPEPTELEIAANYHMQNGWVVGGEIALKAAQAAAQVLLARVSSHVGRLAIWCNVASTPLSDNSVSLVGHKMLWNRLPSKEALKPILAETSRILRPGGALVVQVPSRRHYKEAISMRWNRRIELPAPGDDTSHPEGLGFSEDEVFMYCQQAGLDIEKSELRPFKHHYENHFDYIYLTAIKSGQNVEWLRLCKPVLSLIDPISFRGEYIIAVARK